MPPIANMLFSLVFTASYKKGRRFRNGDPFRFTLGLLRVTAR